MAERGYFMSSIGEGPSNSEFFWSESCDTNGTIYTADIIYEKKRIQIQTTEQDLKIREKIVYSYGDFLKKGQQKIPSGVKHTYSFHVGTEETDDKIEKAAHHALSTAHNLFTAVEIFESDTIPLLALQEDLPSARPEEKSKETVQADFRSSLIRPPQMPLQAELLQEPVQGAILEPSQTSEELSLRSFNPLGLVPKEKLSPHFRRAVQALRTSSRRRFDFDQNVDIRSKDAKVLGKQYQPLLSILQREARFLGITEVEYKSFLLDSQIEGISSIEDFPMWPTQIAQEASIAKKLYELSSSQKISQEELKTLCALLKTAAPLSKPPYLSALFILYKAALEQGFTEESKELVQTMQQTVLGLNSRKLALFCTESLQHIHKKLPQVSKQMLMDVLSIQIEAPKISLPEGASAAIQRQIIIEQIKKDRKTIEAIYTEISPKTSAAFSSHPLFSTIVSPKIQHFLQRVPDSHFHVAISRLLSVLEETQTVSSWQGENPAFFHTTNAWKEIFGSEIGVARKGSGFSGAFAARSGPLSRYGSTCLAFSQELESHARSVATLTNASDVWLGFDRKIPINPYAAEFSDFAQKIIETSIPLPKNLSLIEQRLLRLAIARYLANWTTAYRDARGLHYGYRTRGRELNTNFAELIQQMESFIKKSFQNVINLDEWDPQKMIDPIYAALEREKSRLMHLQPEQISSPNPPALFVSVKTGSCLFQEAGDPGNPPSESAVKEYLQSIGLSVPLIPWDTATLWGNYMLLFGTAVPFPLSMVGLRLASAPIHPEIDFF